jgi:hypothetical protein
MYTCIHTCTTDHAHTHACTHTCMHTCMHAYTHTHTTYMHAYTRNIHAYTHSRQRNLADHLLCLTTLCRECNYTKWVGHVQKQARSLKVIFADVFPLYTLHNQIEIVAARNFDTNVLCKSNGLLSSITFSSLC